MQDSRGRRMFSRYHNRGGRTPGWGPELSIGSGPRTHGVRRRRPPFLGDAQRFENAARQSPGPSRVGHGFHATPLESLYGIITPSPCTLTATFGCFP